MNKQENTQPLMVGHEQIVALIALAQEVKRLMQINTNRRGWRGLKKWEQKLLTLAEKGLPNVDQE